MTDQLRSIKSAVVKITDRCNQDCAFCLDKGVTPKMHMSVEEINDLLDGLKLDCDQLIFMGGETLIIKSFERVIQHAKDIGYKAVGIATNGTFLGQDNYLGRLIDAGLDYLELSVAHVDKEKVNKLSGRDFTYDKMLEALHLINTRKYAPHFFVLFNVVLNSVNCQDLLKLCRFVNENYPNFRRRYNFKSMVLRGAAEKNAWVRAPYSDFEFAKPFQYLEDTDTPFWHENMPLCVAPGFEWHSLNATTRVFNRTYKDINLEQPDQYYDTGFHDTGKIQPSNCENCTLRAICLGVELGYIQHFGTSEFKAQTADPVEVVGKILAGVDCDPSPAGEIHDRLQQFFQLGPYKDPERAYFYFRKGTQRRATFMVSAVEEETRPLLKTGNRQIVFLGDGGPERGPREDEMELMRNLANSVAFMDKHYPEEVIPWCNSLKKEFEDGTLFPGNWVLLPENRRMEYY